MTPDPARSVYAVELRDRPGMYICPATGGIDPMPPGTITAWAIAQNVKVLWQHNRRGTAEPVDCADMLRDLRILTVLWTQYSERPAHDIDPANEHEPGYIGGYQEAMAGAAAVLKTTLGSPLAGSDDKPEQDAKRDFLNLFDKLPPKEQDRLLDEIERWIENDNDDNFARSK